MIEPRQPKVAVIVLTWNSTKWLTGCFDTLTQLDATGLQVELIVCDNGSSDDTVVTLRKKWPQITVIDNGSNLGFAGGNNVGMRYALERGADYVYLLNPDTEVEPDFLRQAVAVAEADAAVGAVQSLLMLHPQTERINSTGNAIHFLGFGFCLDYQRSVATWRPPANLEIAYASGAGILLRGEMLRKIGLLDEMLFAYHEDLELGWRIKLAGWRSVLAPQSVVYHKYEFSRSVKKVYLMERNRYLVLLMRLRVWSLLVLALWLILSEIGICLLSIKHGWWREKCRAAYSLLDRRTWRHVLDARREMGRWRRVGDRVVVAQFVAKIEHQEVMSPLLKYFANPAMAVLWRILRIFII